MPSTPTHASPVPDVDSDQVSWSVDVRDTSVAQGGSSYQLTRIARLTIKDVVPVRALVRVHVQVSDSAGASYAALDIWTEAGGWHELLGLHPSAWRSHVESPDDLDERIAEHGLEEAVRSTLDELVLQLLERAAAVLAR